MEALKSVDQKPNVLSRAGRRVADFATWHLLDKPEIDAAVEQEDRQRLPEYPVATMDVATGDIKEYDAQGREVHSHNPQLPIERDSATGQVVVHNENGELVPKQPFISEWSPAPTQKEQ